MRQRDVLEVVVRTIGILLMVSWVFALVTGLYTKSGLMTFYAFMMFAIGGYLLKGAPLLLDWGYDQGRQKRQKHAPANHSVHSSEGLPPS